MDSVDKNHPPKKRDQKFPSLERLHVLFEYDPETGTLYRKLSGEPVGSPNARGHLLVSIDGDKYYVHQIVWHMFHTKPCLGGRCITHMNRNPADNSIHNLKQRRKRWFSRR